MIEILNGTHETVAYRDMKGIKAFMNTDPEDFPLHWHTALELIMPIKNGYTVRTNGETIRFSPGDIILIPPGELHSLHAPEEGERMIMNFSIYSCCLLGEISGNLFPSARHLRPRATKNRRNREWTLGSRKGSSPVYSAMISSRYPRSVSPRPSDCPARIKR